MVQWLSHWIHNPVFLGSNPSGGKVDSAFRPSEVGEMSSSITNASQVCRGCADCQRSPRWTPSARVRVHTAGAGMCPRVVLQCIMWMTLCGVVKRTLIGLSRECVDFCHECSVCLSWNFMLRVFYCVFIGFQLSSWPSSNSRQWRYIRRRNWS